jgi:hypothetical protein
VAYYRAHPAEAEYSGWRDASGEWEFAFPVRDWPPGHDRGPAGPLAGPAAEGKARISRVGSPQESQHQPVSLPVTADSTPTAIDEANLRFWTNRCRTRLVALISYRATESSRRPR